MVTADVNVLISSAGRRVALLRSFRSALRATAGPGSRVLAADASELSAAFWDADESFLVPRCDDPSFVHSMLEICQRERVSVLVPTIDTELEVYATNQEAFRDIGTRLLISSVQVIQIAADKSLTNRFLREAGLKTVRQTEPHEPAVDIEDWAFPLIAKPRGGSASVGLRTISYSHELSALGRDYIVEEMAPGDEYTIDVFVDTKGQCQVVVPRRRLEVRAGEVSKGRTQRVPELTQAVRHACGALPGASGVLTFQAFFDDTDNSVRIFEINPRFGSGFPLSLAARADFPTWLIEEQLGQTSGASDEIWLDGVTMLRYDDAIYRLPVEDR